MLYLDSCATTPTRPEVIEAIADCMKSYFGNPSSIHRIGLEAERLVVKSREVVAASLGCKPGEIIFTSGGTESNNLAIKGVAAQYKGRGRHLITTEIEHASVYKCFNQLEGDGYKVTYLPVDSTGAVRVEDVEKAITDETILVSVMHVNNETGRIQPLEAIGSLLSRYPKIIFHADAVQGLGKLRIEPKRWQADLLSFSAHKFQGPKGAGFLYKREGLLLAPLFPGGGQEFGIRSGTENVPLIVGMAKAVRMAVERQAESAACMYQLRERLVSRLKEIDGVLLNGSDTAEQMAPHVVSVSVPGIKPEVVVHTLERHGIYISTRSACSSGEDKPSRVLLAMGYPHERAASGLRISFSADETTEQLDYFADTFASVLGSFVCQGRSCS